MVHLVIFANGARNDGRQVRDRGCDADWLRDALIGRKNDARIRLCCTNPKRDSSGESSVVAGQHEQTHIPRLQDPELARRK